MRPARWRRIANFCVSSTREKRTEANSRSRRWSKNQRVKGFSSGSLRLDRVLSRFPPANSQKANDFPLMKRLSFPPAPSSFAVTCRSTAMILVSPGSPANVAIIAPRDEALSQDDDHFALACNKFGPSFLNRFGQIRAYLECSSRYIPDGMEFPFIRFFRIPSRIFPHRTNPQPPPSHLGIIPNCHKIGTRLLNQIQ